MALCPSESQRHKQHPSGLCRGMSALRIFISEIECTVIKFTDDTKLNCALDITEGMDAIQGNLKNFGSGPTRKLIKFNKSRYKLLHMGWGNPRLGEDVIESSLVEKD
ncbi:rna-directed dna polymerase from mobile element jockey-like [Pitangus sulphuratus]|nr:rna-directed dna polymerase from mobile element jockey-like [Pitangus sulphuratus]